MMPSSVVDGRELAGKYRFIAGIGGGGMADVYLAVTRGGIGGFQKLVVIKVLRQNLSQDDEFRQMFLDEAKLAGRLNHPNVVQTNDLGEDAGRYYMGMEYLEGQSFESIRRKRGSRALFPLPMQLQVLVKALCGLHYAHELADYDGRPLCVIHRDVSPSNILITYEGQVKLVDFGIAKAMDSLHETRAGVLKGKVAYMAPEQMSPAASIDRRADIFAAGVILWEILVGVRMWKGLSQSEMMERVTAGRIPAPQSFAPDVPKELERICLKAIAFRREDRYATAMAMQVDLEAFLQDHGFHVAERDVGAAVNALFHEERAQIRAVVEAQLKKTSQPQPVLPDLPRASRESSVGPSSFDSIPPRSTKGGAEGGRSNAGRSRSRHLAVVLASVATCAVVVGGGTASWLLARQKAAPAPPAVTSFAPAAPETPVRGVTDSQILVGMSAPFSGPSRELGNHMKIGLECAFAAVNEGDGIYGRKVRLVALDDGYEGKRALDNMRELIETRGVFAVIGNVGTPTARVAAPYVISQKTLFFGGLTGSNLLRQEPPDHYVFNYRASYEEEIAKMMRYLLQVKNIDPRNMVVFAQQDSFGDAGYDAAVKALRALGRGGTDLLRVGYERNAVDVDSAVRAVLNYNAAVATGRSAKGGREIAQLVHPVQAVVMVATHNAAARFISRIRANRLNALFLNVSFVGSDSLAEALRETSQAPAPGVIVTQVVPHPESGGTGVMRYRETLKKYYPDQQPNFVGLEGYVVGTLFAEALRRNGRQVDTERLIATLESMREVDMGIGTVMAFGMSEHQASHKVWGTALDQEGRFAPLDMD